jgi:hypothetical protein
LFFDSKAEPRECEPARSFQPLTSPDNDGCNFTDREPTCLIATNPVFMPAGCRLSRFETDAIIEVGALIKTFRTSIILLPVMREQTTIPPSQLTLRSWMRNRIVD